MHALHPHPRAWPLGRANFRDLSEGRKPNADPLDKRNPLCQKVNVVEAGVLVNITPGPRGVSR